MSKFYGLSKDDVEMIKNRQTRSKHSPGNQLLRLKTIKARKKDYVKEIQFELENEIIVFESKDYESDDEMFNHILQFLNSIKVY